MSRKASHAGLIGILLVMVGALMLSSKGVFAKLLYAEGVEFQTVATMRALLALPLFWAWALWHTPPGRFLRLDRRAMTGAAIAGFVCYYIGTLIDFLALTMIDASLERVILFSYPVLVVAAQAILSRRFPAGRTIAAATLTYLGVFLAVGGLELDMVRANLSGALLVLVCAATLVFYFFFNERIGAILGSTAFTAVAMTAAAIGLTAHVLATRPAASWSMSTDAWWLMILLVLVATAAPLFMVAEGVKRIGAQRGALLSTVGPPATIVMAWLVLDESMRPIQLAGAALIVLGIIALESGGKRLDPEGQSG